MDGRSGWQLDPHGCAELGTELVGFAPTVEKHVHAEDSGETARRIEYHLYFSPSPAGLGYRALWFEQKIKAFVKRHWRKENAGVRNPGSAENAKITLHHSTARFQTKRFSTLRTQPERMLGPTLYMGRGDDEH